MSLFTRGAAPDLATPVSAAYSALRSLRASAQRIETRSRTEIEQFVRIRNRATSSSSWQSLAWDYYDEIGEVKYAFGLLANTVSRVRLYAAVNVDPSRAPDPVSEVADLTPGMAAAADYALSMLDSGFGGVSGVLRDLSTCLCVPGEAYLVQIPERRASDLSVIPESWGIYSADALTVETNGRVSVQLTSDARPEDYIVLPPNAFVGRIWRNHSRFLGESDSSMRGLLGLMEELLLLNRTVRATARSRLNAGMLYLPDGLSASATSPVSPDDGDDAEEDEFENELIEAMITPLSDESSASAVVPLLVRGPSDLGEKIKYFQFERTFDPALSERADRVLERILQGLDVPKEIVQGLSQVKYSNAVVIDDQFYRTHIEPMTLLICDALTTVFLRPYLVARGFTPEQAKRAVVWYDPSDIQVRPNRSEDATNGYDRYILSGAAWRKIHGFPETDKPDPSEVLQRLVIEKGQIPDALTEALLRVIAPLMMNEAQAANPEIDANLPPEVQQALGAPPSVAPAPSSPGVPEPTAEQPSPTPPPAPPVQPRQTPTAPPGA